MRIRRPLTTTLVALCCSSVISSRIGLARRQETGIISSTSSTQESAGATSSDSSQSTTAPISSTRDTSSVTRTNDASSSVHATATAHSSSGTATTASTQQLTEAIASSTSLPSSNSTSTGSSSLATADTLPIQPRLTPALGIAGIILMIAGAALCVVGIKHRWLYVFLSTAILAGLAVTVLIEYVINPPVNDAVQGAYMVAVVMTGVVLGAVALIFKDVTEGLGCLLGGFCLAMWFLVLSPGGLVSSTTGRAILIGVFCVVCYSLSFSHHTRNYGLILCTAFAGAQVAVIGIDCFSRAGLKEFWLYIWNLNNKIFPIDTPAYPITRGMKVEIACTVVVFIFGVLSQFKIWKVVKERRTRKDAARLQQDEDRAQLESAVGKDIESMNDRDRAQWEATYNDKGTARMHIDSGVGSSVETFHKQSMSIRDREVETVEMDEIPGVRSQDFIDHVTTAGLLTSRNGEEGLERPDDEHFGLVESSRRVSQPSEGSEAVHGSLKDAISRTSGDSSPGVVASSQTPAVTPLPFSIPGLAMNDGSKQSVYDSDHDGSSSALRGLGHGTQNGDYRPESYIEDDRASSVAATADEEENFGDGTARPHSHHLAPQHSLAPKDPFAEAERTRERPVSGIPSMIEQPLEEDDDEAIVRPETTLAKHPTEKSTAREKEARASTASLNGVSSLSGQSGQSSEERINPEATSGLRSLEAHLPQKASKVVGTYRTNEWAKHIADADMPQPEQNSRPSSPGVQIDHAYAAEPAAPVVVDELSPATSPSVSQSFGPRTSQKDARRSAGRKTLSRSPASAGTQRGLPRSSSQMSMQRQSSTPVTPHYAFSRSASAMSLQRQTSKTSLGHRPNLASHGRRSSAPLGNLPLLESPVEDTLDTTDPHRDLASPMSTRGSAINLMDERKDKVLRRPKSASFNILNSVAANLVTVPESISNPNTITEEPDSVPTSPVDEDDLTLAEHRARMHSPTFRNNNSSSRQDTWPLPPTAPATSSKLIYDSHQPKRTHTVDALKQNTMLTHWRQSLQAESRAKSPIQIDERGQASMLSERRQAEWEVQRKQAERAQRQSTIDAAMRSGQLHSAHRDALSRMQAKANKHDL